ncbi:MAG TPA: TonB-dependent receptor, partial [Saprospiraceae bacterium]|nr:TonB-dependent receptor [Saprospiraceae bacterium]
TPITIEGNRNTPDIKRLEPIQNTFIFSGKKSEVIDISKKDLALSEKYGRQIFAKIPGVFIYDMDGTGNQLNFSTRGLDPHRGWEFNIRKDGTITNSDMYGYPASHYNIPMEAVERIELVRGTGSLQYGAQFGGMINYVSKKPDPDRPFSFESVNTIGSYGLLSTHNTLSGTKGKFSYMAWLNKKSLAGYRENSDSKFNAENISLFYRFTDRLLLKAEWTHSNYLIHLAGALTDAEFKTDPRQSTRSRNYYNPDIHIPSLSLNWIPSENTQVQFRSSAVIGWRNSVMFDKPTTVKDTIVTATLQYNNRQVDIDQFNSYYHELRVLQHYRLFDIQSELAAGVQYIHNDLHRRQLGKGSTGSDCDLDLVTPGWGRDLHYKTKNIAAFLENRWHLWKGFTLNAGLRFEQGTSDLIGKINYYPDDDLPTSIKHSFPLLGLHAAYELPMGLVYAGWSQAYRPVILKDIIPGSIYEKTDKDLEDAFGYNVEAGYRGNWNFLKWDLTGFYLRYDNRLGTLAQQDSSGNLIIYRTNIGHSESKGLELFVQADFSPGSKTSLSLFTSTSFIDARYLKASLRSGNDNIDIEGNKVESVPEWISRNGATFKYSNYSLSLLGSYTAESFADAFNTVTPSSSGASGLVPSYFLLDLNFSMAINHRFRLQFNLNNLTDQQYFTKRPQFYPGPGIWPSDGRTFSACFTARL